MENKRPQLNLDELHQLKWLLGGALVLLSVWTVFYLDFEAWTLMGLTTVAVLAALIWPGLPARLPAWTHRLVFPAVVLFFVGDLWITGAVLPAIVRLDILLLLYRGTTYRQKRDDLQVIVLGLFLIVVAGVLTVSLVFAVQILAYTACALAFLLVVNLVESAEPVPPKPGATGRPGWVAHLRWRRLAGRVREVADWRVVALGAALFVGVVGLSALLFLAIPRFQFENSLFLERLAAKKGRTGFTDSIRFGDVTEIQQDNGLALSVDVTDRTQIPAAPYWRMLVLDDYAKGAFKLSPQLRLAAFPRSETVSSLVRGSVRPHGAEPVYWTFYLESGVSRYLPLLGPFEQLRFRETQNFRMATKVGMLALRDEPATMTAYRVEGMVVADSLPDPNFALLFKETKRPDPNAAVLRMLKLGVNASDQTVLKELIHEITGGAARPAADFADRASAWLMRRHAYSLTPVIPDGDGDPLVRWLASNASGHCELFAGSFVLLARAAGLPARVVTGFRGGSWNAYSNNFTIRNSDAHAWCELYDAAAGAWLRVDPTPGAVTGPAEKATGEATLAGRLDRSWSARWDSLRVFWYRRIVNFDQRSQTETLKAVKTATENSGKQLSAALGGLVERLRAWLASPWDARRVAELVAVLTALGGAAWGWRVFGRGWWREFRSKSGSGRMDPVRLKAGRWLRELAEFDAEETGMRTMRGELERLRFGPRVTWPEPEPVFRRARQALRAARRRERVGPASV
jgi:transglutaminase-like putative cysteine protease